MCLLPSKVLLAIAILIWSNKRGGVRTIALQLADGCSAKGVAGKGPRSSCGPMNREWPPWLSGAEHTLCQAALSSSSPLGHTLSLYLQKLVDFPPQLNRLTASEIGFEFLVWTNQWATRKTTKTTTKEMVSECYLKNHRVSKEKS